MYDTSYIRMICSMRYVILSGRIAVLRTRPRRFFRAPSIQNENSKKMVRHVEHGFALWQSTAAWHVTFMCTPVCASHSLYLKVAGPILLVDPKNNFLLSEHRVAPPAFRCAASLLVPERRRGNGERTHEGTRGGHLKDMGVFLLRVIARHVIRGAIKTVQF